MIHSERHLVTILASVAFVSACGGGGLRSTKSISEGDWAPVAEGKEVVPYAPSPGCATRFGKTLEEAKSSRSASLSDASWAKSASSWTVKSSLVDDQGKVEPNLLLELQKSGSDERLWLYSKESSQLSCVYPSLPGVREASAALGKSFSWAPWKASCTDITAGGGAFDALVSTPPTGTAWRAESVTLSADGPLVNLAPGELFVTPTTLEQCFAEAGTPEALLPDSGALAYLRVPASRCETERGPLTTHVACRSTVAAWHPDATGLHAVRRTLGPIHLLDGKPVSGKRFARAVVAIDTGRAASQRETQLYSAIRGAASDLINRGDDSVRIASIGDPSVTTNIKISIKDVTIGELRTNRSRPTARYVVRTDTVRNEAKDSARRELEQAEQLVSQKRSECDSMPTVDVGASQACIDKCTAGGGMAAATCGFTCRDAGGNSSAKNDCDERVDQAENALRSARNAYQSMPDSVTNTVYGDWPYDRVDYARKVTATIQTDSGSSSGQKHATDSLEFEATDYEVVADGAHNVEGHAARRDFIDSPDSILPSLAERASEIAVKRLREAMSQGAIDAALKALAASGNKPKPGFEAVDAMAFDVVGARLMAAESYGDAKGTLPTAGITPRAGECVLAVAVSADATSEVTLATQDRRFADERKRPFATLELCSGEYGSSPPPAVLLEGNQVRWAVYHTRDAHH